MKFFKELKGLPRQLWVLFFVTLINRLGTMALPFLVLYLTRSLGFSASRAGLVLAIYGVAAFLTGPLAGRLSDRFGPVILMKASLFLTGIVLWIFPLAQSFQAVVLMTVLFAITGEIFRPANLSLVSDMVPRDQRKQAFAVSRLAINLGMSVGPALGGFLAQKSFTALFLVDGATSFLAGIVMILTSFKLVKASGGSEGAAPAIPMEVKGLGDSQLYYFLLAVLPVAIVFFQHESAMPLYLVRDLHLSESVFGLMFTLNTLLIVFLELPLNTATAHWSHGKTLGLGAFLFAVGFGALAFVTDVWTLALTVVIWTFGEMILFPASSAYVAEIAPNHRRGQYMGMYSMSFNLAFMMGPWAGTYILETFGPSILWGAVFVLGLVSTGLLFRLKVSNPPKDSKTP